MKTPQILVVDLGSQLTQNIGRLLREAGLRSAILSPEKAQKWLKINTPKGIILSGGDASVYSDGAPQPPQGILRHDVPVLGVCYGMQWMVKEFGGIVASGQKEYGTTAITDNLCNDPLFAYFNSGTDVLMSHGDSVSDLPSNFSVALRTDKSIAAISDPEGKLWGVQFHPESTDTQNGDQFLQHFALKICKCKKDWDPKDIIEEIREKALSEFDGKRVLMGFSGGVDSTVVSAILAPVFGKDFLGVTIDHGGLRQGEASYIRAIAQDAGIPLRVIGARKLFLQTIGSTIDPEVKRNHFKVAYAKVLHQAISDFNADIIVQGTLATDLIESGAKGKSAHIKSHHNVGLKWGVPEFTPLQDLFKYEVRALADALGLPVEVVLRHPFPGPGLFVRIVGVPITQKRLTLARWADAQVGHILEEAGVAKELSQWLVVLSGLNTVCVKGDGRAHKPMVFVRGVKTVDFMTAEGWYPEESLWRKIESCLESHPEIGRACINSSHKPPGTTEFE